MQSGIALNMLRNGMKSRSALLPLQLGGCSPQDQPQSCRHRQAAQTAQLSLMKADAQEQQSHNHAICLALQFFVLKQFNSTKEAAYFITFHAPCAATLL